MKIQTRIWENKALMELLGLRNRQGFIANNEGPNLISMVGLPRSKLLNISPSCSPRLEKSNPVLSSQTFCDHGKVLSCSIGSHLPCVTNQVLINEIKCKILLLSSSRYVSAAL